MANQLSPAPARALDQIGMPASRAQLRLYAAGTLIPVTAYADEALSVAHPWPLVANANGEWPQVFTDGAQSIKAVAVDEYGATLFTLDPAPQVSIEASAAAQISFAPTTTIPETTIQAAIERVQANVEAQADPISQAAPVGAVMAFYLNTAPVGWLAMSGQSVLRATYSALWAKCGSMTGFGAGDGSTSFTLPNLNGDGRFVRGKQTSRTVGSTQADAFQGHNHTSSGRVISDAGGEVFNAGSQGIWAHTEDVMSGYSSDGTNGTPRVSTETRPVNVALLYCIKY